MRIISLCAALLIGTFAFTQNRSIKFDKMTFAEAIAKAKKENKLVFIDAYTTWCGPCKWMSKNMFTNDEIADYYNENFVNAKFDMEKGEGIELAKRFEVRCYPNLLFVDGDGNLVHRKAGASRDVKDYIDMGETAKNPEKRFAKLQADYATKKDDPAFLSHYINELANTCLPMDESVSHYFAIQEEETYTTAANWQMLFYYSSDYASKEFQYLLKNQDKFAALYTQDSVNMKVTSVFGDAGNRVFYNKEFKEQDYKDLLAKIEELNFPGIEGVKFHLHLTYLQKTSTPAAAFDYAVEHGDQYYSLGELNQISWAIYERSDDEKHLKKAASWMKKLTETKEGNNYAYMDTYAAVLFKLKQKDLAKQKAEEAIRLAKADGMGEAEYAETQKLLDKINKL